MTQREKMLVGAVCAAGALYAGSIGVTRYQDALDENDDQLISAEAELLDVKSSLSRAKRSQRKLRDSRKRSLPGNPDIARSLYQDWLRKTASEAGIAEATVTDKTNARSFADRENEQRELTFEVTGKASLKQAAEFLHKFYREGHLQRISKATFAPQEGKSELEVALTVDALILPSVSREDRLADDVEVELPESLDDYRKRLDSRNLFVAYEERSGNEEATAKTEDAGEDEEAKQSMFTGITVSNGRMMSVRQQKSGKVSYYREGDSLEIGRIRGQIVELNDRRVIYKTPQGSFELRLGDTFSEAVPLESEPETSAQASLRQQR